MFNRKSSYALNKKVKRLALKSALSAKAASGDIKVVEFVRFEKGEGLEKREDDFAAEVASMMK